MTSTLEAMARAICLKDTDGGVCRDGCCCTHGPCQYLPHARAALRAAILEMREPSEAALDEGDLELLQYDEAHVRLHYLRASWQAMLARFEKEALGDVAKGEGG